MNKLTKNLALVFCCLMIINPIMANAEQLPMSIVVHDKYIRDRNDDDDEETTSVILRSSRARFPNNLDIHETYTFFPFGRKAFVCGDNRYFFEKRGPIIRILSPDENGFASNNQVVSPKILFLSNNIFNLEDCNLEYELKNRYITLRKL